MNIKLKSIFKTITLSLGALLLVTTATYAAATLIPSGTPGDDTQYTLNDIYNKILDFSYDADVPSGSIITPGTVEPSFRTLSEIYNLLQYQEDLISENIAQGATILGVPGTLSTESAELEWSASQGSMNWDTAVSTCAALAPTGEWRLPTISELTAGIIDDWYIGSGDHFWVGTDYWSDTQYDNTLAWVATRTNVTIYIDDKTLEYLVLCVR